MGRNASAEQSRLQKSTGSRSRSQSRHKPRACYILLCSSTEGSRIARPRPKTFPEILDRVGQRRLAESHRRLPRRCFRARGISLLSKKDVYNGCDAVMASIDELAGILTGDRTHFHLKMHTAHPLASDKA